MKAFLKKTNSCLKRQSLVVASAWKLGHHPTRSSHWCFFLQLRRNKGNLLVLGAQESACHAQRVWPLQSCQASCHSAPWPPPCSSRAPPVPPPAYYSRKQQQGLNWNESPLLMLLCFPTTRYAACCFHVEQNFRFSHCLEARVFSDLTI